MNYQELKELYENETKWLDTIDFEPYLYFENVETIAAAAAKKYDFPHDIFEYYDHSDFAEYLAKRYHLFVSEETTYYVN